jgi:hypothetical protein
MEIYISKKQRHFLIISSQSNNGIGAVICRLPKLHNSYNGKITRISTFMIQDHVDAMYPDWIILKNTHIFCDINYSIQVLRKSLSKYKDIEPFKEIVVSIIQEKIQELEHFL